MDTRRAILDRQGLNLRLDGPIPARQADVQAHLIKVTADPSVIFQVVTEFWSGFWKRDADLNEDELENLLDATENVPPFDPTVTSQEVDNAIAKLSIHKARGPDSWSNGDLKNMPPKIREALCQLFNLINSTGKWPKPLLQATVALLSKTNGSFVIENTRPITILSVIFRLWSKITASKFLLNIRDRLPDAIQGNRPNCASRWLASFTQILAEQALNSNGEFNLASFDLTKAYNLLVRKVLHRTNRKFGTPETTAQAYFGFLERLQRSFRLYGGLSSGVEAQRGVPEGCAFAGKLSERPFGQVCR